jgi:hypothetical protein
VALLGCAVLAVLGLRAVRAALAHIADPPSLGRTDFGSASIRELEALRAERGALEEEVLAADARVLERVEVLSMLLFLAFAVTAVLFVWWLSRARENAELFVPRRQRMNGPQLLAAWLLPGVQLIAPRLAVRDVWHVSQPAKGARTGSRAWYETWWLSWAAMLGVGYGAYWQWWENDAAALGELTMDGRLLPAAAPLEDTMRWLLALGVLTLLCAAAAIAWIWRLTRLQETTHEAGPPAGPRSPDPRVEPRADILRRLSADWARSGVGSADARR